MPGLRRLRDPRRGADGASPSSASRARTFVFVSGIGCSSRFPYYMNTYGFHTHPRPRAGDRHRPQARQPDLDGLGRHRRRRRAVDRRQPPDPHAAPQRRRQDHAVQQPDLRPDQGPVLADLRARQEDEVDARWARSTTRSTRCSLALGAEATFVARIGRRRSSSTCKEMLQARARPTRARRSSRSTRTATSSTTARSTPLTEKDVRDDTTICLEHGKPLVFGKDEGQGHPPERHSSPRSSTLGNGVTEKRPAGPRRAPPEPRATRSCSSRMARRPASRPRSACCARSTRRRYETLVADQIRAVTDKKGKGDLGQLLRTGDTWEVR